MKATGLNCGEKKRENEKSVEAGKLILEGKVIESATEAQMINV